MSKPTDFNDKYRLEGRESVRLALQAARAVDPMPSPPTVGAQEICDRTRLFISASEIVAQSAKVYPLIGKLIECDSTGQVFGPSGHGKTFVVLDMALAVASGGQWNGHQCKKGIVLYFAGEGHAGVRKRIKAWCGRNGNADVCNLNVSASTISFDAEGISAVIAEVRELEAQSGPVALVVIDTLARHIQGDENSTKDMGDFVTCVDSLRNAFPGSAAIVVHHTGNNAENADRSRGSSALKAACDFEIKCNDGQLTFTKLKDGELPAPIDFKLMPVEIGVDDDGEPITSCVVEYGERAAKHRQDRGVKLSREESNVLQIIVGADEGISVDDARAEYIRRKTAFDSTVKPNSIRTTFRRTLETLVDKGEVALNDGVLSRGHRGHRGTFPQNVPHGEGTGQDISLKGCPVCPPCPLPAEDTQGEEIESYTEADFFGSQQALQ